LIALLAAMVAVLFAPALLQPGRVLGNFGDVFSYHLPLRHAAAAALEAGRLPFWNPYIFSGLPFFANSQASLLYPGSILFYILPAVYALSLYCAAHTAFAMLGMHLWQRSRGTQPSFAAMLAAAFALCPYLLYRVPQGIPTHLAALSFIPWCWLALGSRRPGFLAAVWALQFLSGHPQFGAINAGAMVLFAAARLLRGDRSCAGYLSREGAGAAVLCLIQLVLTAQFMVLSNRMGLPKIFAEAYSMPPHALATVLRPGWWGTPLSGGFPGLPSEFFEEFALYIGVVPLGFALASFMKKPEVENTGPGAGFWWLLAGAGVFLALGRFNPLLEALGSPFSALSRVPARFSLLTLLGLFGAAAAGTAALAGRLRRRPALKAVLLAAVLLDLGLWSSSFLYTEDPAPKLAPNPMFLDVLAGQLRRFATGPGIANPNKAMLYRAMNVNGYEAFYLKPYAAYAARAQGGPAADPSRTYMTRALSPEMRRLGVLYTLTREGGLQEFPGAHHLSFIDTGGEPAPAGPRMLSPESWRITGRVPKDAPPKEHALVLSVPSYPGWRAWIDGKPAAISVYDGLLQSVSLAGLPPGASFRAHFRFRPSGWLGLCLLTAAAWLLWLLWAPRRMLRRDSRTSLYPMTR